MVSPYLHLPLRRLWLVAVAFSAILVQGCGAEDAGFSLKLVNNSSTTVVVKPCVDACTSYVASIMLNPGQGLETAQDPDGILRPIQVDSVSGVRLGCLPFRFSRIPPKNVDVYVSQIVPCGESGGSKSVHEGDWPYLKY
jgi:hypothetical protein